MSLFGGLSLSDILALMCSISACGLLSCVNL